MDKWYIIISGLLLLLAAVLFIRLIQYKRQMRIFAAKLQKRLHGGVDQEIHVEYFDRDIVALAKALNDYSDQIKERNRALEQDRTRLKNVIAGISHDFRTPLTAVKGYLQLMKKGGRIDDRVWISRSQRQSISVCCRMHFLRYLMQRQRMKPLTSGI